MVDLLWAKLKCFQPFTSCGTAVVAKFAAQPVTRDQFELFDSYYKPDAMGLQERANGRLRAMGVRDQVMRQKWGAPWPPFPVGWTPKL